MRSERGVGNRKERHRRTAIDVYKPDLDAVQSIGIVEHANLQTRKLAGIVADANLETAMRSFGA